MTHTSRGCNFLGSNPFLPIFSVIDAQRGGLHLFFGHHKQLFQLASYVSSFSFGMFNIKRKQRFSMQEILSIESWKKKVLWKDVNLIMESWKKESALERCELSHGFYNNS
jgi:hypothetical protein